MAPGPVSSPQASDFEPSSPLCRVSFLIKKCGSPFRKWQVRYVALDKRNRWLHYYKTSKDRVPRLSCPIDQFNVVRVPADQVKHKHQCSGIRLESLNGGKSLLFTAEDEKIVEDWFVTFTSLPKPSNNNNRTSTVSRNQNGFANAAGAASNSPAINSRTKSDAALAKYAIDPKLPTTPSANSPALSASLNNSNLNNNGLNAALLAGGNVNPLSSMMNASNGAMNKDNRGASFHGMVPPKPLGRTDEQTIVGGLGNAARSPLQQAQQQQQLQQQQTVVGGQQQQQQTIVGNAAMGYANQQTIVGNALQGQQTIVGNALQGQQTIVGNALFGQQTIVGNALFGQQTIVGNALLGQQTIVGNALGGQQTIIGGGSGSGLLGQQTIIAAGPGNGGRNGNNDTLYQGDMSSARPNASGSNLIQQIRSNNTYTPRSANNVLTLKLTPSNPYFQNVLLPVSAVIRVGRAPMPEGADPSTFIAYQTKVVSRNHAEIWSANGDIYIRDTKSQSGTFLNAMRLGEPGKESKPFKIRAGDILQFGVDFKGAADQPGGASEDSKCVSVRVDISAEENGSEYTLAAASESSVMGLPLPGMQLSGARASPLTGLAVAVANEANHRAIHHNA